MRKPKAVKGHWETAPSTYLLRNTDGHAVFSRAPYVSLRILPHASRFRISPSDGPAPDHPGVFRIDLLVAFHPQSWRWCIAIAKTTSRPRKLASKSLRWEPPTQYTGSQPKNSRAKRAENQSKIDHANKGNNQRCRLGTSRKQVTRALDFHWSDHRERVDRQARIP